MKTYIQRYNKALGEFNNAKHEIMNEIVNMIKAKTDKPIHIGNGYYYYVNHNGVDVLAYSEDNAKSEFLPIYDEEETYDFGWVRFEECCRLFEVIRGKITENC